MADNKKLYDNLLNSGRITKEDIGDFATFDSLLKDKSNAEKLYSNLRKDDLFKEDEIGDQQTFISMVEPVSDTGDNIVEPTQKKTEVSGGVPSEEEIAKAKEDVFGVSVKPDARIEPTPSTYKLPETVNKPVSLKSAKEDVDESIPFVNQNYLKGQVDLFNKMYPGEISKTGTDADKLVGIREKIEQAKSLGVTKYDPYESRIQVDDNSQTAMILLSNLGKTVDKVEEAKKSGIIKNLGKGVGTGFVDYFKEYADLGKTLQGNRQVTALNEKLERIENYETGEELTPGESSLLKAMMVVGKYAKTIDDELPESMWIGNAVGNSMAFMLEFGLTGGGAEAIKTPILKTAAKMAVSGKAAKFATGVGLRVAQAGVQTVGMPTFYKNIAENVSNGQSATEATGNAFYDQFVEVGSERMWMGAIPDKGEATNIVTQLARKVGSAVANAKGVKGIAKAMGEEYLEEKFGDIGHGVKDISQGEQTFKEFATQFVNGKENLRTLAVTSLITGVMGGLQEGARAYTKASYEAKVKMAGDVLPTDIRGAVDDIVSNKELSPQEVGQLLTDVIGISSVENKKEMLVNAAKYAVLRMTQNVNTEAGKIAEENTKSGEELPTPTVGKVEPVEEQQAKLDYLKSRGVVVPDGTDMETLGKMYDVEKAKETEVKPVAEVPVEAPETPVEPLSPEGEQIVPPEEKVVEKPVDEVKTEEQLKAKEDEGEIRKRAAVQGTEQPVTERGGEEIPPEIITGEGITGGIYLKEKVGDNLHTASDKKDAEFVVFNVNGDIAEFSFIGKTVNPDMFDKIARFKNNPNKVKNIKNVVTILPGEVRRDGDSWIVIKRADVLFNDVEDNEIKNYKKQGGTENAVEKGKKSESDLGEHPGVVPGQPEVGEGKGTGGKSEVEGSDRGHRNEPGGKVEEEKVEPLKPVKSEKQEVQAERHEEVEPGIKKLNTRIAKVAKQTGTDAGTVGKMFDTLTSVFGLDEEKTLADAVVIDLLVKEAAKRLGKTKGEVYSTIKWEKGGETARKTGIPQQVLGRAQGAVTFLEDGTAVITSMTDPNVSTPIHEVVHVFEKTLTAREREVVLNWTGARVWTVKTSESLARGMERFLADGKAPSGLEKIFAKFKKWLGDIYKGIKGSEIDIELNDAMKTIYSAMLGSEYVPTAEVEVPGVTEQSADDFFASLQKDENGVTLLQAPVEKTLFQQPESNRERAPKMLSSVVKDAKTAKEAESQIRDFLTQRNIYFGKEHEDIIREAIVSIRLSEVPTRGEEPIPEMTAHVKTELPRSGKFKTSKTGIRLVSEQSLMPTWLKDEFMAGNLTEYETLPNDVAEKSADEIYRTNGLVASIHIYDNVEIDPEIRMFIGANIKEGLDREIASAEKEGRTDDVEYWKKEYLSFALKFMRGGIKAGQTLQAYNSTRIQNLFPTEHWLRKYDQLVTETRDGAMNAEHNKKKENRFVRAAKKAHVDAIEDVLGDTSKRIRDMKLSVSFKNAMTEKNRLLDELKSKLASARQNPATLYEASIPNIEGMSITEVAYGISIANVYIKAGVYQMEKLTQNLINDFGSIGIKLSKKQAEQLIPTKIRVGENVVSLDDYIEEKERKKASKRLANRIFGSVIDKAEKDDPVGMMLTTLMAKFQERNIKTPERTKIPMIEKIAEAIREKETYAKVWEEAKTAADKKIKKSKKLTEAQKKLAKQAIQDAYDRATSFTFSEKQVDRSIREKMKDLGMTISDIVKEHFDVQTRNRGSLTEALLIDSDLSPESAKELSLAIQNRYDNLMAEAGKKLVKRYVKSLIPSPVRSTGRRGAEARLLELIHIGAFEDADFRQAYATARGIPEISEEDRAAIKRQADEIQKQKSPIRKLKMIEDLMGFFTTIGGIDAQEVAESVWFSFVLSGVSTQVRNVAGGGAGVWINVLSHLATNPFLLPSVMRGAIRGTGFALQKAKDVWKYGYSSYEGRIEVPRLVERVRIEPSLMPTTTKKERRQKAFAQLYAPIWNNLKYVSRIMATPDMFNVTGAKEIWSEVLANQALQVRNVKYAFDKAYREQVNKAVDEYLGVSKEQVDKIREEVEKDAVELGYNEMDKKLALMEAIDALRPVELVDQAVKFAVRSTGNTRVYGHLGYITDKLSQLLRKMLPIPIGYKSDGSLRYVHPFKMTAAFTKIVSNVGMLSLDYVPFAGMIPVLAKSYGGAFKPSPGGRGQNTQYYVELNKYEREVLVRRQIVGLLSAAAFWALSAPGDDDDPPIRITANGTGDWQKNKDLEASGDWRPYSLGFNLPNGKRFWITYRYTPLILAFAPMGWARDQKKYVPASKDRPAGALLATGYMNSPSFLADMTAIKSMNDMFGKVFEFVKTKTKYNEDGSDGEESDVDKKEWDKYVSEAGGLVKALFQPVQSSIKGFYSPGLYRDITNIWEYITNKQLEVPETEWEKLIARNPVSVLNTKIEGIIYRDVLGRPERRARFLKEFASVTEENEDLLSYHLKNAPPLARLDLNNTALPMSVDGKEVKVHIDVNDEKESELWDYFVERRGYYLVNGARTSEKYYKGIDEMKIMGIEGEEYAKEIKSLDRVAKLAAKAEVFEMSQYDLKDIREMRGRLKK